MSWSAGGEWTDPFGTNRSSRPGGVMQEVFQMASAILLAQAMLREFRDLQGRLQMTSRLRWSWLMGV